jgi:hypothetical protein
MLATMMFEGTIFSQFSMIGGCTIDFPFLTSLMSGSIVEAEVWSGHAFFIRAINVFQLRKS